MNRKSKSLPRQKKRWARFALRKNRTQAGLSLIELIVASLIISVVMLVIWSGLISLMNLSARAEARSLRQLEVNRAVDFISDELRMARTVNATTTEEINANTDIADLLTSEGFNFNRLGNYGDLALYLEIPGTQTPPAICPTGPNAGSPPPAPSTFDRVIYDVRGSTDEWLGPKTLMRYGRLKDESGSFDPCDLPIASDPIADALSDDTSNVPNCNGILAGGSGFYSCTAEGRTNFTFQHTLVSADEIAEDVEGNVSSRVESIQAATPENVGCQNEGTLEPLNNNIPQDIRFIAMDNTSLKRVFVLNNSGEREFRGVLPGGESALEFSTYLTHPWLVTDENNQCLAIYMPEQSSTSNVFIVGDSLQPANRTVAPPTPEDPPAPRDRVGRDTDSVNILRRDIIPIDAPL